MLRRVTAIVLFIAISPFLLNGTSYAQTTYMMIGIGAGKSCGDWLYVRNQNKTLEFDFVEWVDGFLTGIGSALTSMKNKDDILNGTTAMGVQYWMDSYCKNHASDSITDALNAFVRERLHNEEIQ